MSNGHIPSIPVAHLQESELYISIRCISGIYSIHWAFWNNPLDLSQPLWRGAALLFKPCNPLFPVTWIKGPKQGLDLVF